MYKVFLSYAQLKEYVALLVEIGLLEYEAAEQKYRTTEKGMKFMGVYQHMDNLAGPMTGQTIREKVCKCRSKSSPLVVLSYGTARVLTLESGDRHRSEYNETYGLKEQ